MPTYEVVTFDRIYTTVTVEFADEDVEDKTYEEIIDMITEQAYENGPGDICIKCHGYTGFSVKAKWSRELDELPSNPVIKNEQGVQIYPQVDPE